MYNLFLEKLLSAIRKYSLISNGDSIIIALSGGADSAALLYSLSFLQPRFSLKLYALHIHHGIRDEACIDAEIARKLSKQFNIPFFIEYADVPKFAKRNKMSLEAAGRFIRYEIFREYAKKLGANKVATAHHFDDRAETIMMHIIRGSGSDGLKSIHPIREGLFIRPLLEITKIEIIKLISEQNLPFAQDLTNFDNEYFRNNVRNNIIPEVEKLNPKFKNNLVTFASIINDEGDFINKLTDEFISKKACFHKETATISISSFSLLHNSMKRRVLRKCIEYINGSADDISFATVDSILKQISAPKQISKIAHLEIEKNNFYFVLRKHLNRVNNDSEYKIECPGDYSLSEFGMTLSIQQADRAVIKQDNKLTATFDMDKIEFPLNIRFRKDGDFFHPLGMRGKQKIKNFMINEKIPLAKRDKTPIMNGADGHIIWIIGLRMDDCVKVTSKTKSFLTIEAKKLTKETKL